MKELLTMEELEEEDMDEPENIVGRFLKRPCLTVCITCGLVGYGIFNIVFDWLWVDDMLKAEKGLVFGPPSSQITGTMIWIATIGTVTFLLEITNAIWKVLRGTVIIHEDLNQILSLFLEEVPAVTLNFLLAACREVPISYYQMVKAGLAMVGASIRCLKVLVKFMTVRRREDTKKGLIPFVLRCIILAACAYLLAGSIMTWVYTYSPGADEDSSGIKLPPNLVSKSYDSAKYLYKAGFYLSHPWFNDCNENNSTWNAGPNANWMKLESLVRFEESADGVMTVEYHYNEDESVIVTTLDGEENCFRTTLPGCVIDRLADCQSVHAGYNFTSLEFKFEVIEYTKTLVFGDIRFKAILIDADGLGCEELNVDHVGFITSTNATEGQLQYFKSRAHVNDTSIFVESANSTTLSFYRYPHDVFNVTDVWETGYYRCEMTGSLAPNQGHNIDIAC